MSPQHHHYNVIDPRYFELDESPRKKYLLDPEFKNLLGDLASRSVLDVGCGAGHSTRVIKDRNADNVIGIDYQQDQLHIAEMKERERPFGIQYRLMDFFDESYGDLGTFDEVTAILVTHHAPHVEHLRRLIQNASRVTTGRFIGAFFSPYYLSHEHPELGISYRVMGSALKDEVPILVTIAMGNTSVELIKYYYHTETYEHLLKEAGFQNIVWSTPTLIPESVDRIGGSAFEAYNAAPCYKFFEAKRKLLH